MRRFPFAAAISAFAVSLLIAANTVGGGAATPAITQSFIQAYDRGLFQTLVTLPPLTPVQALGSPGLIQEFQSKAGSTVKCALVKPDQNAPVSQFDTLQMYGDLYTYYLQVTEATAGYPMIDTTACPANSYGTCDYQLFTKDYALFVYSAPAVNYTVADPFYTEWSGLGGIAGPFGVVIGAQTTVTSISKVQATEQLFASGVIFSYPANSATPTVHGIVEPANTAFNGAGGYAALGLPTSEAFQANASGLMRQTFENGRIEWMPGSAATVLFPVGQVAITYANLGLNLAVGGTAMVSATTLDTNGLAVTGRTLTWSTTNGAVATVVGNGYTATVQGVAAGAANIYVTAEGKTSAPLNVQVGSTCCAVGQGAPSAAISQAFQAAVNRNNLGAVTAAALVARTGTGYTQTLTAANGSGAVYVIAEADGTSTAYLLSGALYTAYLANGGFTGPLGYPASDPLAGGAQLFVSGAALAGSPAHVVPASLAARWLQLGGAASGAGPPLADATGFVSFSGVAGVAQVFANGEIFGITGGQAYFSTGLILARYLALSGPAGALGAAQSDVFGSGTAQQENFEAGYIDLQFGATAAVEHYYPRQPALTATPARVVPGGRVHISATGFAPGATLAFTITGQPGFSSQTSTGAFAWDVLITATAAAATVTVQAKATTGSDAASTSYAIVPAAAFLPQLTIVSGDQQTGLPGSTLAQPIVAALRDSSGNPLAGVPVAWTGSPGATVQSTLVTDVNGKVAVNFRLPPQAGVAVGSLAAAGQVVNFSALAAAGGIQNFPAFTQASAQGGLVASLAGLLAWYQNSGALPSPNGAATVAALTQYVTAQNGFVLSESGASFANPWVAAGFASAELWLETTTVDHVRDLLNIGTPVALVLNLAVDGAPGGSAVLDATGVDASASVLIADPNPAYAQSSLSGYLNGFSAQGHQVQGTLAAVIRTGAAQLPAGAAPFTVGSQLSAGAAVNSPAGACAGIDLPDPPGGARFQYCDGTQAMYQVDFVAPKGAAITDLTGGAAAQIPAAATVAWAVSRANGALMVAPQTVTIDSAVDSAAFGPGLSPGGLITIFGTGFVAGTSVPTVSLAGKTLQVLAAFPFQINAALPTNTGTGSASLQVTSAVGTATQAVTVAAVSPGIFMVGQQGAILNQDGTLNGPSNPAQRGQYISIYCAGLGATVAKSGFQTVTAATSVVLNGTAVTPSFAGLVAGFVGLYQINVTIPPNLAPGLTGTLAIKEGSQPSNMTPFALE